ncbi:MAG: hypothetical protein JNG84_14185 [Archangium sp.]|nr:hypothetical protein [Archangium sp.]
MSSIPRTGLCLVGLLLGSGCATAALIGAPPVVAEASGAARVVVVEPPAELLPRPTLPAGQAPGLFTQGDVLADVYARLPAAVHKLRPAWQVRTTSGARQLQGPVALVRTTIERSDVAQSDRTLKNTAFAFGVFIWPLLIWAGQPITETYRVDGFLERYDVDGASVLSRLMKAPGQAAPAVNVEDLTPRDQALALEVTYEEGLLADESPRTSVLVEGVVARLAAAVVAIVEEP